MAKILVVDDEEALREMVSDALQTAGFDVAIAENGRTAAHRLAKETFDLLITDLAMPVMDGFDLILLARKTHPMMPILTMTAGASYYRAEEAAKLSELLGANSALQKPFGLDELFVAVRTILARQ